MTFPSGDDALRLFVETVQDYAMFLLDSEGKVRSWNAGATRLKGYTAEEVLGTNFERFYSVEDRDLGIPQQLLRTAREEGRVEVQGWRVRKDGTHFWADVVITAIRDQVGEIIGFGKVTRDLTERRAADEQREALAAEQAKVRAQQDFLAIASHELRTPLAGISGLAQTMERILGNSPVNEERLQRCLRLLLGSTRRLERLTEDLLDVSSLETGHLPLRKSLVDLTQLLSLIGERLDHASDTHQFTVEAPASLMAWVDPDRIEQVMENLIGNAVRYSPDGGPISIEASHSQDGVEIRVSDQGIMIAPQDAELIFAPFGRTLKAATLYLSGMGLGLYLSLNIVKQHDGRLWVRSEGEGHGSTFGVWLPSSALPGSGS